MTSTREYAAKAAQEAQVAAVEAKEAHHQAKRAHAEAVAASAPAVVVDQHAFHLKLLDQVAQVQASAAKVATLQAVQAGAEAEAKALLAPEPKLPQAAASGEALAVADAIIARKSHHLAKKLAAQSKEKHLKLAAQYAVEAKIDGQPLDATVVVKRAQEAPVVSEAPVVQAPEIIATPVQEVQTVVVPEAASRPLVAVTPAPMPDVVAMPVQEVKTVVVPDAPVIKAPEIFATPVQEVKTVVVPEAAAAEAAKLLAQAVPEVPKVAQSSVVTEAKVTKKAGKKATKKVAKKARSTQSAEDAFSALFRRAPRTPIQHPASLAVTGSHGGYTTFGSTLSATAFTLRFTVEGKQDAHVAFMSEQAPSSPTAWEVVLGGWGDARSELRIGTGGDAIATDNQAGRLASGKPFWIDYREGTLFVGQGDVGEHTFLSAKVPALGKPAISAFAGWSSPLKFTNLAASVDVPAQVVAAAPVAPVNPEWPVPAPAVSQPAAAVSHEDQLVAMTEQHLIASGV